ncbi:MAG: hypothetical protein KKA62_03960 [Nanoarchaeota archaeon]|nr:hypothetical protein [Nanoarchaeota archaeon]MBU1643983.1 hypothetical protein [Nanoarchaeota archaeon]MBU1977078.1 hypothetical protein [Nanoarchaeota archaeon]
MRRIIPRNLIEHLEWKPGQEEPSLPPSLPEPQRDTSNYSVEDILRGQVFYDDKLPIALQQALDYATGEGIVATMPELIAARVKTNKYHKFWKDWYTVLSEENIGIDESGKPVLVTVHGGGILMPKRINQAYEEGLINGSAKYIPEEFSDLLKGKLPDGNSIQLYSLDDLKRGISSLPRRYGVVMPYRMAQATQSGYFKKSEFVKNPVVIARVGGLENLEAYHDKAKDSDGDVGNHHSFKGRDPSQAQGRLLFLSSIYDGLYRYYDLDNYGRFVGVSAGGADIHTRSVRARSGVTGAP